MDRYNNDSELVGIYEKIPMNLFYGSVLYVGMGSAWVPRNQSSGVIKTTIIENSVEIIDRYRDLLDPDWIIIQEDAWRFWTDDRFDFIFIDIWDSLTPVKYIEMMRSRYSKLLKAEGEILFLESIIKK